MSGMDKEIIFSYFIIVHLCTRLFMFFLLIQAMFGCKTECADFYCTKTVAVPVTVLSMATDWGGEARACTVN